MYKFCVSSLAFLTICGSLLAAQEAKKWADIHVREEQEWAKQRLLSTITIRKIYEAAGLKPTDEFNIENLDTVSLPEHKVLLTTWDTGTGHCLNIFILRQTRGSYERVATIDSINDDQTFCTQSVWGAAHAYVWHNRIIVQMPVDFSEDHGPRLKLLCATFQDQKDDYQLKDLRYLWIPENEYKIKQQLCCK